MPALTGSLSGERSSDFAVLRRRTGLTTLSISAAFVPSLVARSSAFVCWPESASTQIGDSAGDENQIIVADLSNLSNMAAREQGVKVIKERQIPFPLLTY